MTSPASPVALSLSTLRSGAAGPVNAWHEIYGDESSGKTTIILKTTIATQQAKDPKWMVFLDRSGGVRP